MVDDWKRKIRITWNRHHSETIALSFRNTDHWEGGVWTTRIASQTIDKGRTWCGDTANFGSRSVIPWHDISATVNEGSIKGLIPVCKSDDCILWKRTTIVQRYRNNGQKASHHYRHHNYKWKSCVREKKFIGGVQKTNLLVFIRVIWIIDDDYTAKTIAILGR